MIITVSIIMKINVGDQAPEFILPAIDGTEFDMSSTRGKRVIFTFFRFSTCPFCNIRINRIIKRWDEFSDDVQMIGVFDAEIEELKKKMKKHNPPFTVVADSSYELFLKHGVEKSFFRFLIGAVRSPITFLQATFKGYFPNTFSVKKMSTIPVDILIDEEGQVVEAHYCRDTADHIPIERLISFSNGQ